MTVAHEPAGFDVAAAAAVIARHGARPQALLQVLRELQALQPQRWLPPALRAHAAQALGRTPAEVEGVAGFYRFLHLQPQGRLQLLASDNITDRMRGSRGLVDALCKALWLEPGRVSADGGVSVGYTSCTGLGDQGPALLINQHQVITRLDAPRVRELAERIRAGQAVEDWPAEWFAVQDNVRRSGPLLDAPAPAGAALQALLARGSAATLAELEASRLRGRGGAGFGTARKWALCAGHPVPAGGTRVVVCNADEGEPGTFKDRVLLTRCADAVFEGMTVAARLIGARQGFVYLRGEYRYLLEHLQAALARRRAAGLLGAAILGLPGFDFDIEIHLGAGAYVCGEESALIESLEGKRGTPRLRPPYPVERGYLGQPTVVNNVESFCAAAWIVQQGAAAWTAIGTAQSSGSKLHSVSGDVERPGIYEFPFGATVAELLAAAGAERTQAVQVSGPAGVCLAAHEFGRRFGFEDLPTAGSLMVFDQTRDMFEVARNFSQFFADESCGFCTPCRVGTTLVARRLDKLAAGLGSLWDEAELHRLDAVLHRSTHCGLGQMAANPLRDTLQRFRPHYERRLASPSFQPAFSLDAELAPARQATGRDDAHAHLEDRN